MRTLCPHRYAISPVKKIVVALSLMFLAVFMVPGNLKAQSNISATLLAL